eukprot:14034834-Alexandrium_andersonii.AAC.1
MNGRRPPGCRLAMSAAFLCCGAGAGRHPMLEFAVPAGALPLAGALAMASRIGASAGAESARES